MARGSRTRHHTESGNRASHFPWARVASSYPEPFSPHSNRQRTAQFSTLDLFENDESWWPLGDRDSSEGVENSTSEEETPEDPVAVLRHRYASGEIGDAEFEARLDALLETPETQAELETERN